MKIPYILLPLMIAASCFGYAPKEAPIMTCWAKDVDANLPHNEYPRPQLERKSWTNLNGVWEFQITGEDYKVEFGKKLSGEILVPFPPQSALSGVMEHCENVVYRRSLNFGENLKGKRALLNFGAVDYECEVYVNSKLAGKHAGGYLPFSFDITDFLKRGENEIIVKVYDPTDKGGQPRGKQDSKPQGIMYTATTGIWQTVWLEVVPEEYISGLEIVPDIDKGCVFVNVKSNANKEAEIEVLDGEKVVAKTRAKTNAPAEIKIENAKLWDSQNPFLYTLKIKLGSDEVKSYFGMRKISLIEENGVKKIALNNKKIFMAGPLDQGFWPDGIYTAPTDEALKFDVEKTLECGYNFTRKHIKVEPARWYYWADKLGLMVWQDMPSANSYNGHHKHKPEVDKQAYEPQLLGMVDFLKNSPAVVVWVLFNESQGQFDTPRLASLVKEKDPTRLINEASGGRHFFCGDIYDIHSYPMSRCPENRPNMALACGEFGGIGYVIEGHTWKKNAAWGYTKINSPEALLRQYARYMDMNRKFVEERGLSAVVYTEITDVEIENNGIFTYDRIAKVDLSRLAKLNRFQFKPLKNSAILPTSEMSGQAWKYTFEEPKQNPFAEKMDDSEWKVGEAPFGKESAGFRGKTLWDTKSIWMRKTFKVGKLTDEERSRLVFRIFHDDNIDIFINGKRAFARGGYTSNYDHFPIQKEGLDAIRENSENVIAVQCRNMKLGQYVDVGIYIEEDPEYEK